jgi:hypothetical protein
MWVTIHDPFARNLGIDDNGNQLAYPFVFIVPSMFFLYVDSLLCHPNFSILADTDCIDILTSADSDC